MNIMKIGLLMLFFGVSLSPGGCREAPHPPSPAPATSDHLKVNSDGTANVTGIVLENNHGCEVDVRCYLRLRIGDSEIVVVYGPAEGEKVTHVRDTPEEWKIKKGHHVKAYGRYIKNNGEMIEVYSSDSYYVHVLAD